MAINRIVPVILSGGSGTRLWPLSTAARPKQFHALATEYTLFQDAVRRATELPSCGEPIVVCNASHAELVRSDLAAIDTQAASILLEPAARNTAPAIAAAAIVAIEQDPEACLLVLAADHAIENGAAFAAAVAAALEAADEGYLVAFGIVPDRAETGYGYIKKGAARDTWSVLDQFVEKPNRETAEAYLASGEYLWNSGMFLMPAGRYLSELAASEAEMLECVKAAVAGASSIEGCTALGPAFAESPANSIDYAVMERTKNAAVVSLDAGWSDVGSWASLREKQSRNSDGNVFSAHIVASDVRNCYVRSNGKRIVIAGLENVVVVEGEDIILVIDQAQSQNVKDLMKLAAEQDD